MQLKILVTGFAPFGGENINPSWEAVKRLPDRIAGAQIVPLQLPVAFARSGEALRAAIRDHSPNAVLCVGQAGGRCGVCVERIAVNRMAASVPDNDGAQPEEEPIDPNGKNAYFATLPVREMVRNIRAGGIPAFVSNSAGTYVCNDVMYRLLQLAEREFPGLRGGFIHVPFLPEQVARLSAETPCMSAETDVQALRCALETIAASR